MTLIDMEGDCEAQELSQLLKQKNVSAKTIMKCELLCNIGCPYMNNLNRDLNQHLIDEDRRRKAIEFPSTTEGDR